MSLKLAVLIAGIFTVFASGCKKHTYGIDPNAAAAMLLNIPNSVPTPDRLEIYKSGRGVKFALWQDFDSRTNNLTFASTNKSEIAQCVESMRAAGRTGRLPKSKGRNYFLRFQYKVSTNELHYRVFVPDQTNTPSIIAIHTGFTKENDELRKWLASKKFDK